MRGDVGSCSARGLGVTGGGGGSARRRTRSRLVGVCIQTANARERLFYRRVCLMGGLRGGRRDVLCAFVNFLRS